MSFLIIVSYTGVSPMYGQGTGSVISTATQPSSPSRSTSTHKGLPFPLRTVSSWITVSRASGVRSVSEWFTSRTGASAEGESFSDIERIRVARESGHIFRRTTGDADRFRNGPNAYCVQVGAVFYRADCLWPKAHLIVELQSVKWHGTKPAITRDATRDRQLLLAGWNVIHVTWAQLHDREEADALERDLRAALRLSR